MKIRRYEDIIAYQGIMTDESLSMLQAIGRPKRIVGRKTPENLNAITLSQLISLWQMDSENDIPLKSLVAVFGYDPDEGKCARKSRRVARKVGKARVGAVVGWCNFIQSELLRISEMWKRCEVPMSELDRKAGAADLDFGFFSIIDAYAQRQGYQDPDDVLKVQWIKIWQSLLKDAEVYKVRINRDRLASLQRK